MTEADYDLVVIGMGAAGLAAAVSFADAVAAQGRRPHVAVLERAPAAERGGATRYTSSWLRITQDGRLDPGFVGLMESVSGGLADLDYCRALERAVPATLDFLAEQDVEVSWATSPFPNRHTGGGGTPVGGGAGIVEGLAKILEGTDGVELFYETEAVRLAVADDGRVGGVIVHGGAGKERTLGARAVVIASGGFEGSREMLGEYLGERAFDLPLIAPGLANNRGEGIRMALEVGADTAGQFDMFHGEPVDPRASKPDPVFFPFVYGIVVNGRAERFFDEGRDGFDATFEALGYEIWSNQEQTAFFIGDQTTMALERIEEVIVTDVPPVTAETIGELAGQLGLDSDALEQTVVEYNAAVGPGEFDPYVFDGKSTVGLEPPKSNWAFPLDSPPFVGYPLTCAITFTFGGIRTDSSARVVGASGAPIPGLYAAGEVTGVYYNEYPAGTSVLRSLTFGRLAGANAARETEGGRG
jgi:tricarballylate dehydrogenase